MEIGGYFEIDLPQRHEYYSGNNIIRLNSGRCGLYHAIRCFNCNKVKLPYYLCESVSEYLVQKDIKVEYYNINTDFIPLTSNNNIDTAFVVTNYFGLLDDMCLQKIINTNLNVIIDNTQAFYSANQDCGEITVYSPRKFFGVPDGSYVIGAKVNELKTNYNQDYSFSTSDYLLKKIELGSNNCYDEYLCNEKRIANTDICYMSKLTHILLNNIDYSLVKTKRQENYDYLNKYLAYLNKLSNYNILKRSSNTVPMVYPFLVENSDLREKLLNNQIYISQWWKYLLYSQETNEWEKYLSKFLLPLPIDQRYSQKELDYIIHVVEKTIK